MKDEWERKFMYMDNIKLNLGGIEWCWMDWFRIGTCGGLLSLR
jgi:hypothetical protein